jgi:arylsulfatase A-like enzyme
MTIFLNQSRHLLFTLHLALVLSVSAQADQRPNILFVFSDDQSYKTLSCYPEAPDWVHTPNIDALARSGIRFERTYFGAWCMPSRASFLTGRLQHGVQSMTMKGTYPSSTYDPQQCRFWPSELRKTGYHTAQIGKWHTGVDTGNGRDWDHQIVWNRPGKPENAGNYFYDQMVTFNGVDRTVPGYSTDNYTDWAVDYIQGENRDKSKPWYLWLCYGAIHGPTTPADRHEGKLAGNHAPVPADIFGPWPDKPKYVDTLAAWKKGDDGKPYRIAKKVDASNFNNNTAGQGYDDWVQQSNECAMAVDEGLGRVMQALRESHQLDNTLIVYAADQGFALGEHGMNNKVAPYDAAIASPMIIAHAGKIAAGKTCRHPVNAPDLVQYFCDAAGLTLPWRTDGRDIRPLIADPETPAWDQPMLMTHTGRRYGDETGKLPDDTAMYEVGGIPWYVLLRQGKYKYVRTLIEGEIEELYDLDSDPEELNNLAIKPKSQPLLAKVREAAIQELRRTDGSLLQWMPPTAAMKE